MKDRVSYSIWLGFVLVGVVILISGYSEIIQPSSSQPSEANPSKTPAQPTATLPPNSPTEMTAAFGSISSPTPENLPDELGLDPNEWMTWPVSPIITQNVKEIYELGQELGRNPHAFSIFGDCQSEPENFLGLYEFDLTAYSRLPSNLQETVTFFTGSLNRSSPTTKPGTATGALLWIEWHEGEYDCQATESPAQCEIRINNPAFVLIAVGTHYESRNEDYMRILIEDLLAQGVVPILSTKADNRELDHSINLQTAQLAVEYILPLWNFWAVTSDLPDNGLVVQKGNEHLGKIYFNDEVIERHRISALQMLDVLWRMLNTGE